MTWLDEKIDQYYGCKRCNPNDTLGVLCAALSISLSLWCIAACNDKVLRLVLQAITSANILVFACRVRFFFKDKR